MEKRCGFTADEVLASAVRGSGQTLTDYQREFLNDEAPLRSVLKARQTGFSWVFALEALSRAIADRHFSIFVSLNREEAAEKILYARDLYDGLPEDMRPRVARAGSYELRFEGGGRLLSFPCRAPRGKAGASVYLDEMAFYTHSDRVYGGALPVITHGGRVTVGSTPCGDHGMFWRVVSEPELASQFSQHRVPWSRAPWLCTDIPAATADATSDTDSRVERYGTEVLRRLRGALDRETFEQEYDLRFLDSNEAFITWEEIESNVEEIPLASTWSELAAMGGRLFAGVDIGRVAHATEIVVLREVNGHFSVCTIKSMVNEHFATQEAAVSDCMRVARIEKACVDATGLGRQFGEDLVRQFQRRVSLVQFSTASKEHMASRLKRALQMGTLTLPRHRSLMEQIHMVRRTWTNAGRPKYDAAAVHSNHADKFWALALALEAAEGRGAMVRGLRLTG